MWWYRCVRYWYRRKSIRNRRYIIIPFYLLQTSSIFLFTANLQHSCKKRKNILIFVPCVRKWNRGLYNTWCWWPASWHCFLWLSLTIITGTGCPCYQSLTAEQAHGDKSTDTHDCGCDGHNLAYFSTHISSFYGWRCGYTSDAVTRLIWLHLSTWTGVLRTAPWSRERPLHWVTARHLVVSASGTSCPSYVLISRLWEWVRTDLPLSIYY